MIYIYRILLFIILAILAGPLYALMINILIATNIFESSEVNFSLGESMTKKATYVWLVSLVIGLVGVFVRHKKYFYFFFIPLIAPSAFAVIYAISL
jgi:hypothetical protein